MTCKLDRRHNGRQAPGRLHRNFQGDATQPERDLIGLRVPALATAASRARNSRVI